MIQTKTEFHSGPVRLVLYDDSKERFLMQVYPLTKFSQENQRISYDIAKPSKLSNEESWRKYSQTNAAKLTCVVQEPVQVDFMRLCSVKSRTFVNPEKLWGIENEEKVEEEYQFVLQYPTQYNLYAVESTTRPRTVQILALKVNHREAFAVGRDLVTFPLQQIYKVELKVL